MDYKDKLRLAKEALDSGSYDKGTLESIFPELAESEDERIRKALVEMIHDTTGDELWVDYNVHKEDALAWLEKQDKTSPILSNSSNIGKVEQKPVEWSANDLPEFESYLCLMFQKFRTKGMCTNGEIIDYVKEHSQKLKDTLCHPWSEEDEDYYDAIITKLKVTQDDALLTDNQMKFLISLKDRYFWWPSEEQMDALHYVTNFDYGGHKATLVSLYEQLKKLREE